MKRRSPEGGDGLELLLDTVCNVFGGIMFIAILVALLTSARSSRLESRTDETDLQARNERHRLASEIASYERALRQLRKTRETVSSEEKERAAAVVERLRRAKAAAEKRLARAKKWLAEHERRERARRKRLDGEIARARKTVRELEKRLAKLEKARTTRARLPLERRTAKTQILVMLAGGRAYVLPIGPADERIKEAYGADDVRIDRKRAQRRFDIRPKDGGGFPLEPPLEERARFRTLLDAVNPGDHFFDLYVLPDSVEAYRTLRKAVVDRGFAYNVHPTDDLPLTLYRTADAGRVQ